MFPILASISKSNWSKGGTAACVIASRLSEDPNVSVLVITKGKVKDDWLNSMPIVGNAKGKLRVRH